MLHLCDGGYFGDDLEVQPKLTSPSARIRAKQLTTLRFWRQSWSIASIREGLQRCPIKHTGYSKSLVGDTWWHPPKKSAPSAGAWLLY